MCGGGSRPAPPPPPPDPPDREQIARDRKKKKGKAFRDASGRSATNLTEVSDILEGTSTTQRSDLLG